MTIADNPGAYELKHDPGTNWIISPIARCISFLASETVRAGVVMKSLQAARLVRPLFTITQRLAPELLSRESSIRQYIEELESVEQWALELEESDFSPLNRNSLVAIWSALEAAIEDTVVLIGMNEREALSELSVSVRGLRLSSQRLLEEQDARRLYRALVRQAPRDQGVLGAFDWILGQVAIKREPPATLHQELAEVNALRNSIVHRAGRIDSIVIAQAPSLAPRIGEEIRITQDDYRRYYDSIGQVSHQIMLGVLHSRYVRDTPELQRRASIELTGDSP